MGSVFVPGVPAPQGSKRHVGHGILVESSKTVGPWRERVALAVADAIQHPPYEHGVPVVLGVRFLFTRPKSHLRANGETRPSAPRLPAGRPDVDKLLRAVLDALTGIVYVDDGQVAKLNAGKEYANVAGCSIRWDVVR